MSVFTIIFLNEILRSLSRCFKCFQLSDNLIKQIALFLGGKENIVPQEVCVVNFLFKKIHSKVTRFIQNGLCLKKFYAKILKILSNNLVIGKEPSL